MVYRKLSGKFVRFEYDNKMPVRENNKKMKVFDELKCNNVMNMDDDGDGCVDKKCWPWPASKKVYIYKLFFVDLSYCMRLNVVCITIPNKMTSQLEVMPKTFDKWIVM